MSRYATIDFTDDSSFVYVASDIVPDHSEVSVIFIVNDDDSAILPSLTIQIPGYVFEYDEGQNVLGDRDSEVTITNVECGEFFTLVRTNGDHLRLKRDYGLSSVVPESLTDRVLAMQKLMQTLHTTGSAKTLDLESDSENGGHVTPGTSFTVPSQITASGATSPDVTYTTSGTFYVSEYKPGTNVRVLTGNQFKPPVQTSAKISHTVVTNIGGGDYDVKVYTNDNTCTVQSV
jgi:hypothetical protein